MVVRLKSPHIPNQGDIVWLDFDPVVGHEQGGRRPSLILTSRKNNEKTGLAMVCPITNKVKGYPFEVVISVGAIKGSVLMDQIKTIDWKSRHTKYIVRAPKQVIIEVKKKLLLLLGL